MNRPDPDTLKTGIQALSWVAHHWDDLGHGRVESEYIRPYLIIRRAGGDYTLFVPVTAEEAVLIEDDAATTRHIPKELRATDDPSSDAIETLNRAFDGEGGGMYPLEDEEGFGVSFREDDTYYSLVVPAGEAEPYITEDT